MVLTRYQDPDVAFTENELAGIGDYEQTIANYLAECEKPNPEQNKALQAGGLRQNLRVIGSRSNLILDPALDSYYLVDMLFNHIPWLALLYEKTPENAGISISREVEELGYAAQVLAGNTKTHDALRHIEEVKTALNQNDFGAGFKDNLKGLTKSAAQALRQLLLERLEQQKSRYTASVLAIAIICAAAGIFLIMAIQNYVSKKEVISARKQQILSMKLAQKNEELESFTYAAAHDLKEPLRTMRCFAKLMKEEKEGVLDEAAMEYMQIIDNTAKRAEDMIRHLIGYTQLSENKWPVEACDCGEEITNVQEDLKNAIQNIKPTITIGAMPVIQSAPMLFRRIMLNLIDNAMKYRRENVTPDIRITARQQENAWQFSVQDNGIGIEPEHIQNVFAPFKRLHPEIQKDGHGIGLTSCKKIVEMLGGKIWLDSRLGEGSTVHFTLPAE
jgi:signal transduction histidine kinase